VKHLFGPILVTLVAYGLMQYGHPRAAPLSCSGLGSVTESPTIPCPLFCDEQDPNVANVIQRAGTLAKQNADKQCQARMHNAHSECVNGTLAVIGDPTCSQLHFHLPHEIVCIISANVVYDSSQATICR
jgi:hypothetical protein